MFKKNKEKRNIAYSQKTLENKFQALWQIPSPLATTAFQWCSMALWTGTHPCASMWGCLLLLNISILVAPAWIWIPLAAYNVFSYLGASLQLSSVNVKIILFIYVWMVLSKCWLSIPTKNGRQINEINRWMKKPQDFRCGRNIRGSTL